jgi:hypothetical protein
VLLVCKLVKNKMSFQDPFPHPQLLQQQLRKNDFDVGSRPSPFGWDQHRSNGTPTSNGSYRNSPFDHRSTPPAGGGHHDDRLNRRSVPLDFQRNQIQQQIHRSASPAQAAFAYKQMQSSFPISSSQVPTSHLLASQPMTSHLITSQHQRQSSIDQRRSYVNQSQI